MTLTSANSARLRPGEGAVAWLACLARQPILTRVVRRIAARHPSRFARLLAEGVIHLRQVPQAVEMVAVARVFRDVPDGRSPVDEADALPAAPSGAAGPSNGFCHGAANYRRFAMAAPA